MASTQPVDAPTGATALDTEAVSYTHLDVYKRQEQPLAAADPELSGIIHGYRPDLRQA